MKSRKGENNANYRGGFESKCTQCSGLVWIRPSEAERGRKFCSKDCAHKWQAENKTGEDHWRFQGGPVERTCETCQKQFSQTRKGFNQSPAKYCSVPCARIGRNKRPIRACEICQVEFKGKAYAPSRFCSRKCKQLSQVKVRTAEEIAKKRLNGRMGSMMWGALKAKKAGRAWEKLAGYTVHDLMARLESLFQDGMTWENIGEWHVDHIRPRVSFSYPDADDPEFRKCWALTNLQPLWKLDNLRKGSKHTPEVT